MDLQELIDAHKAGDYATAEAGYRARLTTNAQDPDALHFLGLIHFQRGQLDEAKDLMTQAVALLPSYVDAQVNLGHVCRRLGHTDEARQAYTVARALRPDDHLLHNGLAMLERAEGKLELALRIQDALIADAPRWADAHYNRARTLQMLGRDEDAAEGFRAALRLDPKLLNACMGLARLLVAQGKPTEAIALFQQVLAQHPELETARHMIAALTGEDVPDRASDAHMKEEFDHFAETFDQQLKRLNYCGPELVREAVRAVCGEPAGALSIIDVGCGTGLGGVELKPWAKHLKGIDLSEGMLEKARARGLYDDLMAGEIVDVLDAVGEGQAELVVGVDVLIYFGALDDVVGAMGDALVTGGHVVFTLEQCAVDGAAISLGHHGRYGHAEDYVRAVVEAVELALISIEPCVLRTEGPQDVAGWVVVARREAR